MGSSQEEGQTCCPFSDPTSPAPAGCVTVSGVPCVFPFTWQGVTHNTCTTAGGFSSPWCSTRTDRSGHDNTRTSNLNPQTCIKARLSSAVVEPQYAVALLLVAISLATLFLL